MEVVGCLRGKVRRAEAINFRTHRRCVCDIGGLIPLTAFWNRSQIWCVSLDQYLVDWSILENIAQFLGVFESHDPRHRQIKAHIERGFRQGARRRKTMHHARESPVIVSLMQHFGHISVGVSGVDNEGEFRLSRRVNMQPEALFLKFGRPFVVVIVQPCFTDPDHLWVLRHCDQCIDRRNRFFADVERVRSGGVVDGLISLRVARMVGS